ncbi:MAG: dihydroneopterin aldolase [Acidimicrobiales bacterium]
MSSQPPGTDRISVHALRVMASHGALPEERERPQPFELDLEVHVGEGTGARDVLDETVDYGAVIERVAALVRHSSFVLLEALADAVAAAVIGQDPRVVAVRVQVRKVRPPIPEDVAAVGVSIFRQRQGLGGR